MSARSLIQPGRRGGWWGIAFVILLLVSAGMISLPTAAFAGQSIVDFYSAHRQIVVWQQIIGALALVPLLAFVAAIRQHGRWLLPAAALVVAAELASNLVPLAIALSSPSAELAHSLTVVEDVADAALFGAIAFFVLAATSTEPAWVRALAAAVALVSLVRALASPLGVTALDVAAPVAFIGFVILLSIRLLGGYGPAHRLGSSNP